MNSKPTSGLAVDVGTTGNPGIIEWCIVDIASGKKIYQSKQYPDGTNNIGEALAIVDALVWLKEHGRTDDVFSDSFTARTWIAKCRFNTKTGTSNAELRELIQLSEQWLRDNPSHNAVKAWDTHTLGEIPADYGRKS